MPTIACSNSMHRPTKVKHIPRCFVLKAPSGAKKAHVPCISFEYCLLLSFSSVAAKKRHQWHHQHTCRLCTHGIAWGRLSEKQLLCFPLPSSEGKLEANCQSMAGCPEPSQAATALLAEDIVLHGQFACKILQHEGTRACTLERLGKQHLSSSAVLLHLDPTTLRLTCLSVSHVI